MTEDELVDILEAFNADGANLTWDINYELHDTIPEDDVIRTEPPYTGNPIPYDSHIEIYVSSGAFPLSMSRWTGAQDPVTAKPFNEIASEDPNVVVVVFVDLDIPDDRIRVSTADATIEWGGEEWLGVGRFGGIEAVSESIEVLAQPLKLTLSGVESSYVASLMDTLYHGSPVSVYVGMHHRDTYALIDDPEVVWEGYIDVMTIEVSGGQSVIRVDCEHRLRRQPSTYRYTDEDQRSHYSADRFFDKLHLIPGYTGTWGSRDTNYTGGGGGHRGPRTRANHH
jgi:hypothetical protein